MFDQTLNKILKPPLKRVASGLIGIGLRADHITWAGFLVGMSAVPLIAFGFYQWAILSIMINRLADGLDGAMARLTRPTELGAFLDISLDFLFYASIPLSFVLADASDNGLAGALLIYCFIGTGCTFLAFAALAAKRGEHNAAYPDKGIYYLGGLTESTETIFVFVLMCLWPQHFSVIAYCFAALCALTTITRICAGIAVFKSE